MIDEPIGIHSLHNACCYRDSCRKQADRIAELEKIVKNTISQAFYEDDFHRINKINAQLQFENDAFRKELFNRGSMDSCSRSAHRHGFVSPAQAGDDAREYIAEILKKASEK
jgi:predicted transcriptional regulator